MIRVRRITQELLDAWLVNQAVGAANTRYRLRVYRANSPAFDAIKHELHEYITEALDDARLRLRKGFEDDLSPFTLPSADPAENFPRLLNIITLKGYWGETLAVIGVEGWGAHNHTDWCVPAMLFRFHDTEFQHLEEINQRVSEGQCYDPDDAAQKRPGRTGDDALAFRINNQNVITDILAFESKCLETSNTEKIKDAHQKLSAGPPLPSGVRELINLLEDYDGAEAARWRQSLLALWREGYKTANRSDGLAYACGKIPKEKGRVSWLDDGAPHGEYKTIRNLDAFEFQFPNLKDVVVALYRP